MIDKKILQRLIQEGVSQGADFCEIFLENTHQNMLRVTGQEVTDASSSNVYGAGVRLIQGNDEVYGYTNQVDEASLERIIQNLRVSFEGPKYEAKPLGDSAPYDPQVKIPMETKTTQEKAEKLLPLTKIMADYDEELCKASPCYRI